MGPVGPLDPVLNLIIFGILNKCVATHIRLKLPLPKRSPIICEAQFQSLGFSLAISLLPFLSFLSFHFSLFPFLISLISHLALRPKLRTLHPPRTMSPNQTYRTMTTEVGLSFCVSRPRSFISFDLETHSRSAHPRMAMWRCGDVSFPINKTDYGTMGFKCGQTV